MQRTRKPFIASVALLVVVVAVVLLLKPPPQAVRDLVALAPAGSPVALHRIEPDRSGWGSGPLGAWHWSFAASDPAAALETYRAWFVARGFSVRLERARSGRVSAVLVDFVGLV